MNVDCTCAFCGYTWVPRVQKPVSCPRCKRYIKIMKQIAEPEVIANPNGSLTFDWRKVQPLPTDAEREAIEKIIKERWINGQTTRTSS